MLRRAEVVTIEHRAPVVCGVALSITRKVIPAAKLRGASEGPLSFGIKGRSFDGCGPHTFLFGYSCLSSPVRRPGSLSFRCCICDPTSLARLVGLVCVDICYSTLRAKMREDISFMGGIAHPPCPPWASPERVTRSCAPGNLLSPTRGLTGGPKSFTVSIAGS
jgi:hypothetical protein